MPNTRRLVIDDPLDPSLLESLELALEQNPELVVTSEIRASKLLEAHRAREERERKLALLVHRLRSPLTALKLSTELLSRRAEDPEAVRALAERVDRSVDRADSILREITPK